MTKSLILAAVLTCATAPAFAQSGGWNSQSDSYGNTYSQGTGSNEGWNGSSQSDAYGNTYSNITTAQTGKA